MMLMNGEISMTNICNGMRVERILLNQLGRYPCALRKNCAANTNGTSASTSDMVAKRLGLVSGFGGESGESSWCMGIA
jgi:hypothetical protein